MAYLRTFVEEAGGVQAEESEEIVIDSAEPSIETDIIIK